MRVEIIEKNGLKFPKGFKGVLKVGFFDNAKYPNGEYVAQVAFWNEYGTISKNGNKHIPPRPFIRNVTDDKAKMQRLGEIAKIELSKGQDSEAVINTIGEQLVTMIKQSISQGEFEPNAPYTIAKKGSSRPLVDTGLLMSSVDFKVEK